jgi:deoxyribodipyrimidine photo-lyase
VPELAGVKGSAVHTPWTLPAEGRRRLEYPDRIVDHEESARAFRERRA